MIRSPISAAAALLILATTAAHAEVIHVNVANLDPAYSANFGGLSFNLNTAAATVGPIGTGTCGSTSGVYTSFTATGGVSDASLIWNGVDYSLQSASFTLDPQGGCAEDMNIALNFGNGTTFIVQDQPTNGPYLTSQDTPSQVLASTVLYSYNGDLTAAFLDINGQPTGDTGLAATTTAVPEPGTFALLAAGLAGLAAVALSKRQLKV